mmetsp:Transcript_109075/g.314174  ORF Transcript_109075/g.314174 Transcript_109075/m.314174 type:complete len:306 (+) Transcript_109075:130-1047(+)
MMTPRGMYTVAAYDSFESENGKTTPRGMYTAAPLAMGIDTKETAKLGFRGGKGIVDQEDIVSTPRNNAPQSVYTATWARLRSPSPEGNFDEDEPVKVPVKCIWKESERGLPALPRAWRTPDPSPMRDGGVPLPAAKPAELWEETSQLQNPAYVQKSVIDFVRPPRRNEAWARLRTPSPEQSYPMWGDSGTVPPPSCFPLMLSQQVRTPRSDKPEAPAAVPTPPPPPQLPQTDEEHNVMSMGTRGHPDHCGAPCKYFWKASGCKDGASCDRCHLCKWVRPRKKADGACPAAAAPAVPRLLLSEMVL